jgi:protein-tyrosine phosphatase
MVRVLFVCLGNICRSPTAEGVFRKMIRDAGLEGRIQTDSAGTHAYHVGAPPDRRAQQAAARRGVDLSDLRGRQALRADFSDFDYVLAMDEENHANLLAICPPETRHKLSLFMSFAAGRNEREVPDPYYGGDAGFDRVLDMIEAAAAGLLDRIRRDRLQL